MALLSIADFPALQRVLADRDIRVTATPDGHVSTNAPPGAMAPETRMAIRRYRDLLVWTVAARQTSGHVWAPCSVCGEVMLLAHDRTTGSADKPGRPCAMTPGCTGYHQPPGDHR